MLTTHLQNILTAMSDGTQSTRLAINLAGVTVTGGSFSIHFVWTEE